MNQSKKISIVIPYYNRLQLLYWSLKSIMQTKYSNYEIIIIDDASDDFLELNSIASKNINVKVIHIDKEEKGKRTNPCIPINKGIQVATGDIIIIQNPESYHIGDILSHTAANLTENDYFVYSAYNIHSDESNKIFINLANKTLKNIMEIPKEKDKLEWYQHPEHRNNKLHFCASIFRRNIEILGGFDEEYKKGVCFDDDDFVFKVEKIAKLNLKSLDPENNPYIVNLYHPPSSSMGILLAKETPENKIIKDRWYNNRDYYNFKTSSINPNFNYPRIVHFFWFGPLPFLNFLSILSFHKYHPAWVINVYKSNKATDINIWKTGEQRKMTKQYKDYFIYLYDLPYVNIINADDMTKELGIQNIYMTHQSDVMRMYILKIFGGVYSDFDIIYTDNIEKYFANKTKTLVFDRHAGRKDRYCPNALFLANRGCGFCDYVIKRQLNYIKQGAEGYNNVGPEIIRTTVMDPKFAFALVNIEILDSKCYLPIEWNELDQLYKYQEFTVKDPYFSVHWFNGAARSKEYMEKFNVKNFNVVCKMDKLVGDYIDALKIYENDEYYAKIINQHNKKTLESVFTDIYRKNLWNYPQMESKSGTGSTLFNTIYVRQELPILFKKIGIVSILDAGCGDFNWFKEIRQRNINYIGVDIVKEIITENNKKYQCNNIKFVNKDFLTDDLPKSDIIICRDCLVSLSNSDIKKAITNFKKSGSKYLLTTNFGRKRKNIDVTTGSWRPLCLENEPFNLPSPIYNILEKCTEANNLYNDKSLSLWNLSSINLN